MDGEIGSIVFILGESGDKCQLPKTLIVAIEESAWKK